MIESRNNKQDCEDKGKLSFGEHLCAERKRQSLSVEDVAKAIHLSEKVIEAIDQSDISQLPQPTFVQGYLRAYAKFLSISETLVLEEYAHAVPHQKESDLQPRSTLPDEASSNTPFVKMITIALLVMTVFAALYASFTYYKNAIESDDVPLNDSTSLSLPESDLVEQENIEDKIVPVVADQKEALQEEIKPALENNENVVKADVETEKLPENMAKETEKKVVASENIPSQRAINQLAADGEDSLQLLAEEVSWVEVEDANGVNLYYDLLQQESNVTLRGAAPFKVFLGNAPRVKVTVNDLVVNIDSHIRSNKIANFSISVDQQQIVFH